MLDAGSCPVSSNLNLEFIPGGPAAEWLHEVRGTVAGSGGASSWAGWRALAVYASV